MASEKGLTYYKWFFDVVADYETMVSNEQMGELFFAVMRYASTGEKSPVSDGVKWPFQEQCRKVDAAKKSYAEKCETAARNGAAGGRAKARNVQASQGVAAEAKEPATFTPPTKTEFKNIVKHFAKNDEIEYDAYELDEFYSELKDAGWKISGEPIRSRGTIEAALLARFPECPLLGRDSLDWICFSSLFSGSHGRDDLLDVFAATYSETTYTWSIGGETFDTPYNALNAFLANLAGASDSYQPLAKPSKPSEST